MKKTFYVLLVIMAVFAVTFYNCSKSETTTTVAALKITGTVTISDTQTAAGGAVITISSQPNAASVLTKTIADSSGKYTFSGLEAGTYYISAKYNTENTNLKSTGIVFTTASEVTVSISGTDAVKDIALVSTAASSGTDVVEYLSTLTSSSAAAAFGGKYYLDQTHSKVGFTFAYDSANGEFFGHFASFGLNAFKFDQANPANSSIDAWVDITSTETGAPSLIDPITKVPSHGRDGINGCISSTFAVAFKALADLAADDTVPFTHSAGTSTSRFYKSSAIVAPTGIAGFLSSSVAAYGDGYVAKGNLTFRGVTKPVSLYFHYIKGYTTTATVSGASVTTTFSSFSGFFLMNAKSDFGVVSGHVKSNPVTVVLTLEFSNKK